MTPAPSATAAPLGANGSIFFTAYVSDDGPHIYRARADGSRPHVLTSGLGEDFSPQVSPDGQHVVFESNRTGNADIYRMRADGSHLRRLTTSHDIVFNSSPSWSPDGRHIIYNHTVDKFTAKIWIMDANGGNQHPVGRDTPGGEPTFTPDGRAILFNYLIKHGHRENLEVYKMNLDGTHRRRLTRSSDIDRSAVMSPDGRHIVFLREEGIHFQVWTMDADGRHQRAITHDAADHLSVSWSPDGRHLIFTRYVESQRIWVMDPDGRNAVELRGTNSPDVTPSWGARPSTCLGRPVTIRGTDGPDVLRGTPGPDVMSGRGGNDVVRGGDGNDVICGGTGSDVLDGGPGADTLWGGRGSDLLLARDGETDRALNCGSGHDVAVHLDPRLDPRPTHC